MKTAEKIVIAKELIESGVLEHQTSKQTLKLFSEFDIKQNRICDKLDNVADNLDKFKKENDEGHEEIKTRQDFTNGKVRKGEIWRHSTIAMGGVITAVVIPLVLYIAWDTKNDMEKYRTEHVETANAVHDLIVKVGGLDKTDL